MGRDGASLGLNYMGPMFTFMNKPDGGGANTKMRRDVVALSAGRQKHTNFADLILAQFRAALLRPANPIPTKNPEAVFNILLRRCPLKVWQSVIGPVSILMVALIQSCSNSVKRIQHQAVNLFRSALQIHTEVAILIHRRFKNSAIGAATGKVTFNPSEITDAVLPIKPHNWFPSFIHVALLLLSHLLCNSIYAANPAFSDFNTAQFGTNGGKISIKSGASITNLSYLPLTGGTMTGSILGGATNDLGSAGNRFHDLWLGHNADVLGTLFVAGETTLSNPGNGNLLRTDSSGKVKAATIGTGLSFDGTTLAASGGGSTGSTNYRSAVITLTVTGTNVDANQIDFNLTNQCYRVTATGNLFFGDTVCTNVPATNFYQWLQLDIVQDGTGTRTVTFTNSIFAGVNGTIPYTTNANAWDSYTLMNSRQTNGNVAVMAVNYLHR